MKKQAQAARTYNYEWTTAEEIIANKNEIIKYPGWGEIRLIDLNKGTTDEDIRNAHELWLKLKEAFNAEAKTYKKGKHNKFLGSIGTVENREVCRYDWWRTLGGDSYGDYDILTAIIEALHQGEKLETGIIHFGS